MILLIEILTLPLKRYVHERQIVTCVSFSEIYMDDC